MTSNPKRVPNLLPRELLWEIQGLKTLSLGTKILGRLFCSLQKLQISLKKRLKMTNVTRAKTTYQTVRPKKALLRPQRLISLILQLIRISMELTKTWIRLRTSTIKVKATMQINVLINNQKTSCSLENLHVND